MSLQTAYNEGASINEAALDTTINITQSDTGASNYLLKIGNSGSGRGLQIDNNGASYALVLRQFGAGNCVAIGQKSTSMHNVLELENSGSGKTVQVLHAGSGNVIDVTNSGTGIDLKVVHTSTLGGNSIEIINGGGGSCIVGRTTDGGASTWSVNSAGYATFTGVDAGCGKVYASNTPIAGGRVHVYQRSEGPVGADLWCNWGVSAATWEEVSYLPSPALHVVRLAFDTAVECPIIKVTPWPAGQYDETQNGMFNYLAESHGNIPLIPITAIEPHITQLIPIPETSIAIAADLYFQYCRYGDPAAQGPYEVYWDEGVGYDLVFDFEVLGCAIVG